MIAGAGETFQEIIGAGSIKVNIPGLPGHHSIRRAWSRVMTEVGWIYPGIPRHSPGFPAGRRLNNLKGTIGSPCPTALHAWDTTDIFDILRLWRDNSTYKFQHTTFLKLEFHEFPIQIYRDWIVRLTLRAALCLLSASLTKD